MTDVVSRWDDYAERVGVDDRQRQSVGRALRLRLADEPPRYPRTKLSARSTR